MNQEMFIPSYSLFPVSYALLFLGQGKILGGPSLPRAN